MPTIQKKICLLGAFGVGKTSLVRRYVEGAYDDRYLSTLGVKISQRTLLRPYGRLEFYIWDLAGQDEFMKTETHYLTGLAGAFIVCDLTRPDTLRVLEQYIGRVQATNPHAFIVLVGNKADLSDQQQITYNDLVAAGRLAGALPCLLTSAKTGENVEAMFAMLAEQLEYSA
ncbi:MAG: Rab family GTPase [Anaerolineae bacterium]